MSLLKEIQKDYKAVSIVGMAKNSGKTTTLNYLIEEAYDEGLALGITSTGRDGETKDIVTGTDKPKVYLYEETLVSVPVKLYDRSEGGLEILRMTEYRTALGEILICKVKEAGYVQIAGPSTRKEQGELTLEMLKLGADMVLIDGAVDRKAIASPKSSDGVILATGAVISRSMKKVVEETAHVVRLYSLPEVEDKTVRELLEDEGEERTRMIEERDGSLKVREIPSPSGFISSKDLDWEITDITRYVYIKGAFTYSVIRDINPKKFKSICFVLKDPTKIFIDSMTWNQLIKKGLKVKVLDNIKVLAVTLNPTAPQGYSFDSHELLSFMKKALPDIRMRNVRSGEDV